MAQLIVPKIFFATLPVICHPPAGRTITPSSLEAFGASIKDRILHPDCCLRLVKYLNNIIEQAGPALRRRRRAMQCFRSFHRAERTLEGVEAQKMMREAAAEKVRRGTRGRLGEVRREPIRPRRTAWVQFRPSLAIQQFLRRNYLS